MHRYLYQFQTITSDGDSGNETAAAASLGLELYDGTDQQGRFKYLLLPTIIFVAGVVQARLPTTVPVPALLVHSESGAVRTFLVGTLLVRLYAHLPGGLDAGTPAILSARGLCVDR